MIKLKTVKTAQSIKNYDSNLLFCDKFDLTYYPEFHIVDVFWKSKGYRCFVSVPNIAYMEPLEEVEFEQTKATKNNSGAKKA